MQEDQNEKKYVFLVSDGMTLGYNDADNYFKEAISFAKKSGVNVVGIGTGGESKLYTACFGHDEITRTVLKFIKAYVSVAQADL